MDQLMKWTREAEAAIKKVPFFVRKKVRTRVEKEAHENGKPVVTIAEVKATQKRYLTHMESEVKGYQLDSCFGPNGCPNRTMETDALSRQLTSLLESEDLLGFLKENVNGSLKFHHELRLTLAECPNACSQPQIKDIGIIGACMPGLTAKPCSRCEACVDICKEDAVLLADKNDVPEIDSEKCIKCGQCIPVCPTGTLSEGRKGYRVQLGGKLGRHPQLAREMPGIYSDKEVVSIVKDCIIFYKKNSRNGIRFAKIFKDEDFNRLTDRYKRENYRSG
jgi:anaerobic sulfite reductase subunit C